MKFSDLTPKSKEQEMALNNTIFCVKSGSTLYGTTTENSDDDAIGIFIEDLSYKIGQKRIETVEFKSNKSDSGIRNQKGDLDVTLHSLDKFIKLAINNNPTICELFFAPENCLLKTTSLGNKLKESYPLFISKKLYHSLCGYAYSQIDRNKIKSGNNSGRQDLIREFTYDVKMASHALRLYIEAIELLGTGELRFPLKLNQKIIDCKTGKLTYEQFQEEAKKLEEMVNNVYAHSTILYAPEKEKINELQMELYRSFYGI